MKGSIEMPNAIKWLSEGLQEVALQTLRGDARLVATELKLSEVAVRQYFKGEVPEIETGKRILKAMRKIVLDREKEIKKLVA